MDNIVGAFISGLSEKERKMLYGACAFVCLAIFDRLVLGPLSHEAKMIEERIESQKILIKKNLLILQYKDKILNEDAAYSKYFTKKGLTQEELIASFLSEVEELADASGVSLANINPVTTEEKTGYMEYSLVIECFGLMDNLSDFMHRIDNSKKPIRIFAFDISPKKRATYEVNCVITVVKVILIPEGSGTIIFKPEGEQEESL